MAGEMITVEAIPGTNQRVASIKQNDVSLTVTDNRATFEMPAGNVNVTATFTQLYTITVAETTNGTISLNKTTAAVGEIVTVTISPNEGYQLSISNVTLNGAGNTRTFTMSDHNVTIEVSFTEITFYGYTPVELWVGNTQITRDSSYHELNVLNDIILPSQTSSQWSIGYLSLKTIQFQIDDNISYLSTARGNYYKPKNIGGLIYTDNILKINLESVSSN